MIAPRIRVIGAMTEAGEVRSFTPEEIAEFRGLADMHGKRQKSNRSGRTCIGGAVKGLVDRA